MLEAVVMHCVPSSSSVQYTALIPAALKFLSSRHRLLRIQLGTAVAGAGSPVPSCGLLEDVIYAFGDVSESQIRKIAESDDLGS